MQCIKQFGANRNSNIFNFRTWLIKSEIVTEAVTDACTGNENKYSTGSEKMFESAANASVLSVRRVRPSSV